MPLAMMAADPLAARPTATTFAAAWAAEARRGAGVHRQQDPHRRRAAAADLEAAAERVTRVYRLQTDAGERIIGRQVSPAWVASALEAGTSQLSPDAAFAALLDGKTILDLAEGLQLRRARVMGAYRIELPASPMRW